MQDNRVALYYGYISSVPYIIFAADRVIFSAAHNIGAPRYWPFFVFYHERDNHMYAPGECVCLLIASQGERAHERLRNTFYFILSYFEIVHLSVRA